MEKKDAILRAALELFSEKGYHGTSVAEIAQKAQVGAGTIYRYFKDKKVLVNYLFQHWKKQMSDTVLIGLDENLPPRQLFHAIWSRLLEFSRKHTKELMFLEFHHHAPYLDKESRCLDDYLRGEFRHFFDICRREQIIKEAPPELLMNIVTGSFIALEKAFLNGEIANTPENDILAEELCWEAIRR